jgi:ABC-type nickel/cobalt efflux system permease component RcnA
MERRDRIVNVGLLVAALLAWVAVVFVVLTQDPIDEPVAGLRGAALMGLASALTVAPLAWLAVYARHRRIAYRGDWARALRRAGWVGRVVGLVVAHRLQGVLSPPIVGFVVAIVLFAEVTLTVDR